MRIAHLMLEYLPLMGGAQICVDQLARHQIDLGHDVSVITANWHSSKLQNNVPYPITVMPRGLTRLDRTIAGGHPSERRIAGLWLWQLLRKHQIDVVNAHMAHSAGVLATAWKYGPKIVVTSHGIDVQQLPSIGYGMTLNPEVTTQLRRVSERAHAITVVGRHMLDDWKRICASANLPSSFLQIPNGSSTKRISTLAVNRQHARDELGIGENESAVLCLGRNHPKKNFVLVLDVVDRLRQENFPIKAVLIGEGFESILDAAATRGLADYFVTAGPFLAPEYATPADFPLDAQIRIMKACDIMLLPSLLEGFPLVVPEALACGLAVATTEAAGVDGVFSKSVVRLFNPASLDDATRVIRELCRDAKSGSLQKESEIESLKLDWAQLATRYIALYKDLIRS